MSMSADAYAIAYNKHYKEKNYPLAIELYLSIIRDYPDTSESSYAEQQIRNIAEYADTSILPPDLVELYSKCYAKYVTIEKENKERAENELVELQKKEQEEIKRQEELRSKIVAERDRVRTLISDNTSFVVYDLSGVRGRSMKVYTDRVVINTDVTVGSILTNNATDGEKTIFYKDVVGIQFKKPGLTIGYLQLENAAVQMNNKESNFFSENTFTFEDLKEVREAKEYITWEVSRFKQE